MEPISSPIATLSGAGQIGEKKPGYVVVNPRTYPCQDYLEVYAGPGYPCRTLNDALCREVNPNTPHLLVTDRLRPIINDYFRQIDPQGEVFTGPLDLTLGEEIVVQPDLIYVSGRQRDILKFPLINGPPTLVVEVLAPGSTPQNRLGKLPVYLRAGVNHFWIVNPQDKTLECFALQDNRYYVVAAGRNDGKIRHPDFAGLVIDLAELWEERNV